jgi:hypothetical protein
MLKSFRGIWFMRRWIAFALLSCCLYGLLAAAFLPAHAAFECGNFDGKFTCRAGSGEAPRGKNAPPVPSQPAPESVPQAAPSGEGQLPASPDGSGGTAVTPGPAGCAPGSELLGGKCVRYYAACRAPVAASALVQSCAGTEEKLVCKPQSDGMKECCCLVYDKL